MGRECPRKMVLSERQLEEWGARVGREVRLPIVLALRGGLGVGKSTLARAIARGAGVTGNVPSPTYNLLLTHPGARAIVQHLDLYRLTAPQEVWELGWAELGGSGELVMIEWPERVEKLLPADRWDVMIAEVGAAGLREVSAVPVGSPPALPAAREVSG